MSSYLFLENRSKYWRSEVAFHKKAKTFYSVSNSPNLLIMKFEDYVTRDDDSSDNAIVSGKGQTNAKINDVLFRLLGGRYTDERCITPIKTHYIRALNLDEAECLVHRMAQAIPLEVIVRNRAAAAGSYVKRHPGTENMVFEEPICEFTLKDDVNHDPLISRSEIIQRGIAIGIEVDHMQMVALAVNRIISEFFLELGIELVDFKLVFGRTNGIVGDYTNIRIIGELSPDVFRLRDKITDESLDKDLFRQHLPGLAEAYEKVLQRIRNFEMEEAQERRWATMSSYNDSIALK